MKQTILPFRCWQKLVLCLTLSLNALIAWSGRQYTMDYHVDFDTLGHYLLVTLDYAETPSPAASDIVLNMPVWERSL